MKQHIKIHLTIPGNLLIAYQSQTRCHFSSNPTRVESVRHQHNSPHSTGRRSGLHVLDTACNQLLHIKRNHLVRMYIFHKGCCFLQSLLKLQSHIIGLNIRRVRVNDLTGKKHLRAKNKMDLFFNYPSTNYKEKIAGAILLKLITV